VNHSRVARRRWFGENLIVLRYMHIHHPSVVSSITRSAVHSTPKRLEMPNHFVTPVYAVVNHQRFLTRPPVKGFNAPLPREAGKEILFFGFRRSCLRDWLLSLLDFFAEAFASAPSTSMSVR